MTPERSKEIIRRLFRYYKTAEPALSFSSRYQLAIAVVLSAQTTDRQVNSVTPRLFEEYPDFAGLASAKVRDVEKIIKSTGFYHHKARHIVELSRMVQEQYGGTLPGNREELMKLPGVGRKTANVILSIGFDEPAFAVDTHISRIAWRLGYAQSRNPLQVERAFTALVPRSRWTRAHVTLILHGRTLCKARNPLCAECPVCDLCRHAQAAC